MLTKYAQEKTFAALYIKKMHKFILKQSKIKEHYILGYKFLK